jgi:hypothetical protein
MDKTYKDRLALRKSILNQHHDIVVAVNDKPQTQDPRTHTAVSELYTFILGKYLPTRYPSMFKLRSSNSNPLLENLVTGAIHPTTLSQSTPTIEALEILTQTVDEEFLILLPELSPENNEQPKYILQAYATCFPSGFNTREKLGLRLADIHKPVPGYKEKIERSMDRFFARIEVGRFVRRVNWSVTIATDLFAAFGGTHAVVGKKEAAIEPGKLNVDEVCLLFPLDRWWIVGCGMLLTLGYRPFFGVNGRLCIGCLCLRRLSLPFIRIRIRLGRLGMKVSGRIWRLRLMVCERVMCLKCISIRRVMCGAKH